MIDIENKDILQICVTIIAGALIFVSLTSFSTSEDKLESTFPIPSVVFGMVIIVIFSIAARVAIGEKKEWSLRIMSFGFGFLIGAAAFIVIMNFLIHYRVG